MEAQIIGVKQLYKDLKKISDQVLRGQSFLVVKNSKPIFRIEPIKDTTNKQYSLSDAKKIQFVVKDKDLSSKIDKQIY
ncbi:MAG: hypothetical protein WC819_01630 [Parcubacteria group bacterium]|jgi:antitoxin (DNA-binding transcriptional repressor) of toxin-antitoxin stability system